MDTSPDPQHNTSPGNISYVRPKASLFQLFTETFFLLGRYFIIVYPVFLYFILSSIFIPKAAPDFSHPAWWIISIGWLAILFIFKAGWNVLMLNAVKEWLSFQQKAIEQKLQPEDIQQIPFSLLKEFIPGMGQYGPSFLLGGLIWLLLTCLPVLALLLIGFVYVGIPQFITVLLDRAVVTPQDIQNLLDTLSHTGQVQALSVLEQTQLHHWSLIFIAIVVLLIVINALTLFWQQFIVIKDCNPFKAFFYSGRHALRHPVNTFLIMFYFNFFYMAFSMMVNFSSVAAFFGSFLLILTMVFFGLFMFLYLLSVDAPSIANT